MRNALSSLLAIALFSTSLALTAQAPLPEPQAAPAPPAPPTVRTHEEAARAGLQWLARHQSPDGRWSSAQYRERCGGGKDGAPCRHLDPEGAPNPAGIGVEGRDVAMTGLALIGFLGFGHTHRDGSEKVLCEASRRGMEWLVSRQVKSDDPAEDGLIVLPGDRRDGWVLDHAIATRALSEQLFLSRDRERLARPVEAALRWCLRSQNPGLGWKDGVRNGRSDTLVTGWMALALKTGKACAIARLIETPKTELDAGLAGAVAWFDGVADPKSGWTGYQSAGDSTPETGGAVWDTDHPGSTRSLPTMTAIASLCRIFGKVPRADPSVFLASEILLAEPPSWERGDGRSTIDPMYWYFASYHAYQHQKLHWERWEPPLAEVLLSRQRVGGCEDGSYDPLGAWGRTGGRVAATALGVMTLEFHQRFEREHD